MTREEIIRMAQQVQAEGFAPVGIWPEVRRLCELAYAAGAAAEREACAAICDRFQARDVGMQPAECAGAIRARGNT